jgi:cytochrome c2
MLGKHNRSYWVVLLLVALFGGACTGLPGSSPPAGNMRVMPEGDAAQGWQKLQTYGCHTCHTIPGVPGFEAVVGPPLNRWAERHYIAGTLPNTPDNLVLWLQFPQSIEPGTAMPNLGVSEQDARDMGAYLYTLRR